tara:strand:+ start:130 stop:522 length:393 start_codon:yes stop_codon:yes gene_type:complete
MRNDIEVYYQRVKKALCRREVLQTTASLIMVICIFHFITRPKIKYRDVVEVKTEYVDKIVEVEKIIEVDKIVKVDKIVEVEKIIEIEPKNTDDDLDFDVIFKKKRTELGSDETFFWRNKLYSTNYKEEVE